MKQDLLETIANYVLDPPSFSQEAMETASLALLDALGCALLALQFKECKKLLGPIIPGTHVPLGSRVIGTSHVLDPILAAFDIGILIRWLDYNDTFLAKEWGHPSDNLGALLSLFDFLGQKKATLTVHHLLLAMIQAYEIQGGLALENSLNEIGLDHVLFVKIASAALSSKLLGGGKKEVIASLSHAFIDLGPLRTYRHAPCTGSRKSWAAGDATSRGLELAWRVRLGEMGYEKALEAHPFGFYDVLYEGKPFSWQRPLGCYVMENLLFKVAYPAEFHAQTAVECALKLHPEVKDRIEEIEKIEIFTHQAAIKIINKQGPLLNPADRDHCLQYMVAIPLLFGKLTATDYEEKRAQDARIDVLREKMVVQEDLSYSKDYLDPDKRSIASRMQIFFQDGSSTPLIEVEYPLGHRKRRQIGKELLFQKFKNNAQEALSKEHVDNIVSLFKDLKALEALPVYRLISLFIPSG